MDGTFAVLLAPLGLTAAQVMIFGLIAVIVMGLVAVIKQAGCPSQFLPIWSLVLGVALCNLAQLVIVREVGAAMATVVGLIVGLVASGMWSGGRAVMQGSGGRGGWPPSSGGLD